MNRAKLNLTIDLSAFAAFVLMSSTGFILEFILPPGSGRIMGEGMGWRAAARPVSLLWGLTRHEWGNIHLWAAIGFLAILSIHLALHWRWILCAAENKPQGISCLRFFIGIMALLILLSFAIGPFLSPIRKIPRSQLWQERQLNNPPNLNRDL